MFVDTKAAGELPAERRIRAAKMLNMHGRINGKPPFERVMIEEGTVGILIDPRPDGDTDFRRVHFPYENSYVELEVWYDEIRYD